MDVYCQLLGFDDGSDSETSICIYPILSSLSDHVCSSTECGFSESINSIFHNHPITTINPLDFLPHLYSWRLKHTSFVALPIKSLVRRVWEYTPSNTCSSNTGLVMFREKENLGFVQRVCGGK